MTSALVRIGSAFAEVAAHTASLVVPRACPCGTEDTWLCGSCRSALAAPPVRVEACCDALQELCAARIRESEGLPAGVDHRPILPVMALGEYEGALQRLILAWKNGGMPYLAGHIAPYLRGAVETLGAGGRSSASPPLRPALVPVPSTVGARLRRGQDHTAELVHALARIGAGHARVLPAVPTTAQGGRTARQRRGRQFRVLAPPRLLFDSRGGERAGTDRPVVIVDDVVTTGSTLRGMHDALVAAGMQVVGAVVIASARLPSVSRPR